MVRSALRPPLLGLALLALIAALWAGWIRLGWNWPPFQPTLPTAHGPLMVAGFLGTVVSLERAVALRQRWMLLSPLLSGLGGLAMIAGLPGLTGPLLFALGSLLLVAIFYRILRQHSALYTVAMALGALAFAAGNILWLAGWSIPRVVLYWQAFLVLTISGERLELARLLRFSPRVFQSFMAAIGLLLVGLLSAAFSHTWGTRLFGVGLLALAIWLFINDVSRHTVRSKGLPRYAATCLLLGYVWLSFGGLLGVAFGGLAAGLHYDAFLHSVFVGFVISMIFGHAPIIFPAILGLPIRFTPLFYAPLILLHASLVMRIAGDLMQLMPLRQWGGLINGITILLFLAITATTILQSRQDLNLDWS